MQSCQQAACSPTQAAAAVRSCRGQLRPRFLSLAGAPECWQILLHRHAFIFKPDAILAGCNRLNSAAASISYVPALMAGMANFVDGNITQLEPR